MNSLGQLSPHDARQMARETVSAAQPWNVAKTSVLDHNAAGLSTAEPSRA